MQLELDPPEIAEAQENLDKAAEELAWCSASPVDIAHNDLARARAFFLEGEMERAEEICLATFEVANSEAPSSRRTPGRSSARSRQHAATPRVPRRRTVRRCSC